MNNTYLQVQKKAQEILEKYGLPVPVPVFELADMLNIKWKLRDSNDIQKIVSAEEPIAQEINRDTDILGFFDKDAQTFYINNTTQSIRRKRFTMAHEIGHMILHNHNSGNNFRKAVLKQNLINPPDATEAEANYFASYLLMPDNEIEKRLAYTDVMPKGEELVSEMAKTFAVSPDAMRIRLRTYKKAHPDVWEKYEMEKKLF